jgi:hypothetical protein
MISAETISADFPRPGGRSKASVLISFPPTLRSAAQFLFRLNLKWKARIIHRKRFRPPGSSSASFVELFRQNGVKADQLAGCIFDDLACASAAKKEHVAANNEMPIKTDDGR